MIVPSVIAMRQWGDFEGWEHQLVLDEARRRFALGARLGAPFIVATPPLEMSETGHLPERYRELLEIGREEGIRPTFEYISFFKSVHTLKQAWEIVKRAAKTMPPSFSMPFTIGTVVDFGRLAGNTPRENQSLPHRRCLPWQRTGHPNRPRPRDDRRWTDRFGCRDRGSAGNRLRWNGKPGTFQPEVVAKDPSETLKIGLERMKELFKK